MSNETPKPLSPEAEAREQRVDGYLSGTLQGEELAAFERDLASDPSLAEAVETQSRMDDSIRRLYVAPAAPDLSSLLRENDAASLRVAGRIGTRDRWMRLALAALILLTVGVGISQWSNWFNPPGTVIPPGTMYTRLVTTGWQPAVVCKTDAEFIALVRKQLGQGLSAAASPAVQMVGWGYKNNYAGSPLSDDTMMLLTDVDGEHVLVLIDRVQNRRNLKIPKDAPEFGRLNIFKRRIGDLIIYEITPKKSESVLPLLSNPDKKQGCGSGKPPAKRVVCFADRDTKQSG